MKKKTIFTLLMAFTLVLTTSFASFANEDVSADAGTADADKLKAISDYLEAHPDAVRQGGLEKNEELKSSKTEQVNNSPAWLKLHSPADNQRYSYNGSIEVKFESRDIWNSYYTFPLVVWTKNGNVVEMRQGEQADMEGWSTYKGSQSIKGWSTGLYEIWLIGAPCYKDGTLVPGWSSWTNIPAIFRTFYITPSGKVNIKNTIANSAKRSNDVIWDKSKVKAATNYQISWRAKGGQWAYKNVGNTVRGATPGLKVGQMYEIRVRPYGANNSQIYGAWSNTVYRYFHTTEKIRLRSTSKGSFTISWKNNPNATSYQVMFTTNKNGSGAAKNINTIKKGQTSFTKKGLRSGVTYYVQIREVRNYAGKNWVGNISKPVRVKVR